MRAGTLGAIALAFALASCAGPAGNVNVLRSGNAIVPGSAVAWAPLADDQLQNGDPRIDNDIIRQRMRTAVEAALTARGFTFVQDADAARYLVSYHMGLQERQDIRVDSMGPRGNVCGVRGCVGGFGWGMYGAPTNVRTVNYVEGTVILDLTDRSSDQLAWRATSQRRVNANAGSQANLNAALADMVRSLP